MPPMDTTPFTGTLPSPEHQPDRLLRYFTYEHLPKPLQEASWPFCALAERIDRHYPPSAERTVALRKLLEAKDCLVRAALDVEWDKAGAAPGGGSAK